MTKIIDGKAVAKKVNAQTATAVAELAAQGIQPGIAVIIVGDDAASQIYVRNKTIKPLSWGCTPGCVVIATTGGTNC